MTADEILARLISLGLTQDRIAGVIRRDRSAVSRMLAGERQIKTAEIAPLERLIEEETALRDVGAVPSTVEEAEIPMALQSNSRDWPRDVPLYGTALGAAYAVEIGGRSVEVEQTILEMTEALDHVRRPPSFANNRTLYALYVVGSSMEPRYEPGEMIYVDPRRPPAIGDHVIVQLRDGNGHDGSDRIVSSMVKRLVRRSFSVVELEQYNPAERFSLPVEQIAAIHRVVRWGEVFGT